MKYKKPLLRLPSDEELASYAQMPNKIIKSWPPFATPYCREFETQYEAAEKAKFIQGVVWLKHNFVFSIHSMNHIW
jgi:hypothetical protein